MERARDLYRQFTGEEPKKVDEYILEDYDTYIKVGQLEAIAYNTVRDGNSERYLHKFKTKSMPDFCISHDGKSIKIIGNRFEFTETGINDK